MRRREREGDADFPPREGREPMAASQLAVTGFQIRWDFASMWLALKQPRSHSAVAEPSASVMIERSVRAQRPQFGLQPRH